MQEDRIENPELSLCVNNGDETSGNKVKVEIVVLVKRFIGKHYNDCKSQQNGQQEQNFLFEKNH